MAIEVIKLNIQGCDDREAMTVAFANNGYKVWVEKKEPEFATNNTKYYVCFERKV